MMGVRRSKPIVKKEESRYPLDCAVYSEVLSNAQCTVTRMYKRIEIDMREKGLTCETVLLRMLERNVIAENASKRKTKVFLQKRWKKKLLMEVMIENGNVCFKEEFGGLAFYESIVLTSGFNITPPHCDRMTRNSKKYTINLYVLYGETLISLFYFGKDGKQIEKVHRCSAGQGVLILPGQKHAVRSVSEQCIKVRVARIDCEIGDHGNRRKCARSIIANKISQCCGPKKHAGGRKRKRGGGVAPTSKHHYTKAEIRKNRRFNPPADSPGVREHSSSLPVK